MSSRWSPILACWSLLILKAASPSVAQPEPPADLPGGGAKALAGDTVVEMLSDLAARGEGYVNSELVARRLAQQVRAETDLKERVRLTFLLGKELLHGGKTEEAIGVFMEIRTLFEKPGVTAHPALLEQLGYQLAIADLRLAEQDNCIALHVSSSCLFPLDEAARHRVERGSRAAIRELEKLVRQRRDLAYRWLWNLAAMTLGEYPDGVPENILIPLETFESEFPLPRFTDYAGLLGLDVLGTSGGAVMEDIDRDGYLDILASAWGLKEQLRFFRNNGDGTFSDLTEAAGLVGEVGGLNMIHADYNNDGYPDVLVLRGAWLSIFGSHPNSLLRNNGDGTFTDVTVEAGLLSFHPTQTASWADYDQDGWLDLFIGNETDPYTSHPCELYRNNGDGTFSEIAEQVGLKVLGFVKGVTWGDFNNDGRPDLYVSRFDEPNLLFRNDGPQPGAAAGAGWRFAEVAEAAGVSEPRQSFPTWFWDYDNDGHQDLLVASFLGFGSSSLGVITADYLGLDNPAEVPRLYHNRGDGTFADVTSEVGLDKVLVTMGANFGDLDNDGFLDAYFATGEPDLSTVVPNRMFRNDAGRRFQDVTTAGGFGHLQKGHGVAFGDLDNDGDQDIYEVLGGAFSGDVFQNALFLNPGTPNRSVTLLLEGTKSNRAAIGARLRLVVSAPGGRRSIYRTVSTGGSFGSSSLQQEVGLGNATALEEVEVTWPSNDVQVFQGLELDRAYRLREGEPAAERLERHRLVFERRPSAHEHPAHSGPP